MVRGDFELVDHPHSENRNQIQDEIWERGVVEQEACMGYKSHLCGCEDSQNNHLDSFLQGRTDCEAILEQEGVCCSLEEVLASEEDAEGDLEDLHEDNADLGEGLANVEEDLVDEEGDLVDEEVGLEGEEEGLVNEEGVLEQVGGVGDTQEC